MIELRRPSDGELCGFVCPADARAWQIACIVEARPGEVRLALDYYPMPGVPILTVGPQQFAAGAEVRREPVGAPDAE